MTHLQDMITNGAESELYDILPNPQTLTTNRALTRVVSRAQFEKYGQNDLN